MKLFIPAMAFLMHVQQPPSFKETQLTFNRVKDAYRQKEITVKNYFSNKNLIYQGTNIFLRAFKKERILEVWVKNPLSEKFDLLLSYDFCAVSGDPGPKRNEGDRQIPEGVYHINHFNPLSNFYLSLGINYPNKSDKILGGTSPGSAIYIHGDCVTIGCIPITDDKIKELYLLCVEARNNGQKEIPVHIFPARLSPSNLTDLKRLYGHDAVRVAFWENLRPVYQAFEDTRLLNPVKIDAHGRYHF
jgi:murein L,D-transpeptidase YafK